MSQKFMKKGKKPYEERKGQHTCTFRIARVQ